MTKQIAPSSGAPEETDRFKSTDKRIRNEVDLEIWREKQRGTRTDHLDLKFGCAPKRIAEALQRLKDRPPEAAGGIGGLEKWQLEPMLELHRKKAAELPAPRADKPPTWMKRDEDTLGRLEKARLAWERNEAIQRRASESAAKPATRGYTRQNGTLLQAIRDKAAAPKQASGQKAPLPDERKSVAASIPTNNLDTEDAQKSIEAVVRQTKLQFGATDEELHSSERNFRSRGYRLAILLVLDHVGVRPEIAGATLKMKGGSAKKYLQLAAQEIHDNQSAVYYFTKALCLSMKISLADLKAKLQ